MWCRCAHFIFLPWAGAQHSSWCMEGARRELAELTGWMWALDSGSWAHLGQGDPHGTCLTGLL